MSQISLGICSVWLEQWLYSYLKAKNWSVIAWQGSIGTLASLNALSTLLNCNNAVRQFWWSTMLSGMPVRLTFGSFVSCVAKNNLLEWGLWNLRSRQSFRIYEYIYSERIYNGVSWSLFSAVFGKRRKIWEKMTGDTKVDCWN